MKSSTPVSKQLALGLLALALIAIPPAVHAEDSPKGKLSKTKEKYDVDKDGMLNEEEQAAAREGAKAKAKATREENQKKALARYDANGNGRLDDDELARKKADDLAAKEKEKAAKEARKAEREARKADKSGESSRK